jgi:hypothetical protein
MQNTIEKRDGYGVASDWLTSEEGTKLMYLFDIGIFLIVVSSLVIACEMGRLRSQLHSAVSLLQSLDEELFRSAQERNPHYGLCSRCGRRALVRHVIPVDGEPNLNAPEVFYCKPCWWLSSSVKLGDEQKCFKDRLTEQDAATARMGPG